MINNKEILAIIPARGGSKGVPRKNIKLINGKPLIAYTIETALKSKYIDRVMVSTEDKEIAEISKRYGGEVPFLRPKELAEDNTPGIDPILHCINWLEKEQKYSPYYTCLLQCTSPFRKTCHIDEAIEMLEKENSNSIVSVCKSEVTPYWMKTIDNNRLRDFIKDSNFYARRQDIPDVYRLNGAIYIAETEFLIKNKNWYDEDTLPYIMNRLNSIDIDEIIDFNFAEFLIKENKYV